MHVSVAPLEEDVGPLLPQQDLHHLVDVLMSAQGEVGRQGLLVTAYLKHLTYKLFAGVQVGGSENVVPLQRLEEQVVPDAGDTVGGIWCFRGARGS